MLQTIIQQTLRTIPRILPIIQSRSLTSITQSNLPSTTTTMTTAIFKHIDTTSYTGKPWGKVDTPGTSFTLSDYTRPVTSLRGQETSFTTENSGFAVYNSPSTEKLFTDETSIRSSYYAEVTELLKAKLPGKVKKVVIFDHTIRRRTKDAPRQPVQQVHVDQTPGAAAARVRRHVTDEAEAEELLKGRYAIINVWRPIGNPANDFPLAVVDWRSTRPEDFVAVDLMYPVREEGQDEDDRGKERLATVDLNSTEGYEARGETFAVRAEERHAFYYVKDMLPEEVMFLKCFDSAGEGVEGGAGGRKGLAVRTPHTAFVDPETRKDAPGRQSIEVRCLVFYE